MSIEAAATGIEEASTDAFADRVLGDYAGASAFFMAGIGDGSACSRSWRLTVPRLGRNWRAGPVCRSDTCASGWQAWRRPATCGTTPRTLATRCSRSMSRSWPRRLVHRSSATRSSTSRRTSATRSAASWRPFEGGRRLARPVRIRGRVVHRPLHRTVVRASADRRVATPDTGGVGPA